MAKFKPAPDLEEKVLRLITPPVVRIAGQVEREAKALAPPTKTWISMRDGGVRRQHRRVDGDEIPDNLKFELTSFEWDVQHPGHMGPMTNRRGGTSRDGGGDGDAPLVEGHHTYLRQPRDTTAGAYIAVINCRCRIESDPDGIAKLISRGAPVRRGHTLTVTVVCEGDYVRQAEYGEEYPGELGGGVVEGVHFMRRAAANVAAKTRARR